MHFRVGSPPVTHPVLYGIDTPSRGELIGALGSSKAILVGHDWGAEAVYAAIGLGPEKVTKLVTVEASVARVVRVVIRPSATKVSRKRVGESGIAPLRGSRGLARKN